MRIFGNILWHVPFLGFLSALGAVLIGGVLVITVVAAPIGMGLLELSKFLLAPFTQAMVSKQDLIASKNQLWGHWEWIVRVIYFPIGLLFAGLIILQVVVSAITIIGIPVAIVSAKSLATFFNPVNKKCVSIAVASELARKKAQTEMENYAYQPTLN